MAAPWDAIVTTGIGAAATILGILIGGVVGRRNQNQQWLRDTQAAAYAAYLREFTAIEIELREAYLDHRPNTADWAPFNAALTSLSLVAAPDVAHAAGDLTDAVGRFALMVADQGPRDRDGLRQIMSDLASGQVAFVNAARRSLDASQHPLNRQLGGPPPWREVEPYVPAPHAAD
ncbi:hypothetical protein AB0G35_15640 [Streptomyces sp. NPDC021749]|uniref:hypothetical protein n=1 Tax=Streptomyces sp. NPDC021749 TaxID=3154905 RepID=UPI0034016378